jgi:hypothetical protein
MVAFCILLAPILLLGLSYLEHVFIGTHRLKEALHVDQLLHELDAALRRCTPVPTRKNRDSNTDTTLGGVVVVS